MSKGVIQSHKNDNNIILLPDVHYIMNCKTRECNVCLEEENVLSMSTCDVCYHGTMCFECTEDYQDKLGVYIYCPLCRNMFVSFSINSILKDAWLYGCGIVEHNRLFDRWIRYCVEADKQGYVQILTDKDYQQRVNFYWVDYCMIAESHTLLDI
jgi:hypothetical protein